MYLAQPYFTLSPPKTQISPQLTEKQFNVTIWFMDIDQLRQFLKDSSQPKFRFGQILNYYFTKNASSWLDFSIISKDLRQSLQDNVGFSSVKIKDIAKSKYAEKLAFELIDSGNIVEAVIIKNKDDKNTVCLSCQSGCALGCKFCASGAMGFQKNMTAEQIIDQLREVNSYLKSTNESVNNIVFMGMGEPFMNYDEVKKAIDSIHNLMDIGWRRISVSTCGIPAKILEFGRDFPQVNLAISLHAAGDKKRSFLMPINGKYPLKTLMKTCEKYVNATRRKLFFEYIVIPGFNDSLEDAKKLNSLLSHPLYHLNIIKFHATDIVADKNKINWHSTTENEMNAFEKLLENQRIKFTVRKSFGQGIQAACGMLAHKI
ncbi:MAG TPA: 23S rRNA (adenine(2503)-C(2))-methyltransferase RlmN [Candidatus Bipolaricaulota bacterium]|nr:23S rRNA (adenine(2503)-C(2))-methyltransferase RlmN [Candidatus Bipolaricaulota bacterium]